ncbi:MAG: cell division protein FtsL [Clostridium sp.]|nr:cell division protein FtsL [Clostridium sp.]
MAVNSGDRRRTAYGNNVYVQGNTARRLEAAPVPRQAPVKKTSSRTQKNRERLTHMNIGTVIPMAAAMIMAGLILTWYLTLRSDITNSLNHIAALESTLNELKMSNDENYSRITNNVDLEEIKRVAMQELGMRYAEEGQIITFNGEGGDYVRQKGDIPK